MLQSNYFTLKNTRMFLMRNGLARDHADSRTR
jgi:hypothetical protein